MKTKTKTTTDEGVKAPESTPLADAWNATVPAASAHGLAKLKVLVSGSTGAGKTWAVSMFRRPFVGITELQGIPTVKAANPHAVLFANPSTKEIGIRTMADLELFARMARSAAEHGCDAVVLDGLTDAQRIIRAAVTRSQGGKSAGDSKTSKESWGVVIDKTVGLVRLLRDLPIHVAVTVIDAEVEGKDGVAHRFSLSGKGLPNTLGQFFNAVGYCFIERGDDWMRRSVMFRAGTEYQTKGLEGLDDIEPPEPLHWIEKALGDVAPQSTKDRVAAWRLLDETHGADADEKRDD